MAFDETLAARVRRVLAERPDVTERRMFGGLCFLVRGHMSCGIVRDELMVRVGSDAHAAAMAAPHTRPMDFTGRAMHGFVFVAAPGLGTASALRKWVQRGVDFAVTCGPGKRGGDLTLSARRSERSKTGLTVTYFERAAGLVRQTRPRLETTHQLKFKSCFGAVAGYVNGSIFMSCGRFGVALRLPPPSLERLFDHEDVKPLKYFSNGHVKKEYAVLPDRLIGDKERFKKLLDKSIEYASLK